MDGLLQGAGNAVVFGASGGLGRALVSSLAVDGWRVSAGSRQGERVPGSTSAFFFDLTDEASIGAAANQLRQEPPRVVVVATGALVLTGGRAPEKSYRQLDPAALAEAFRINTIGPALIAKHVLPLMPRGPNAPRSAFLVLGARVGSIGDNALGGWHGYRVSKAALAMMVKNFAIETARSQPNLVVAGLHPGTVATGLSAPFRDATARGVLTPDEAAHHLLSVIDALQAKDSGSIIDWRGEVVPP